MVPSGEKAARNQFYKPQWLRPFKKQQKQLNLSQQFKDPSWKASNSHTSRPSLLQHIWHLTAAFPPLDTHKYPEPRAPAYRFSLYTWKHLSLDNFRARNEDPGPTLAQWRGVNGAGSPSLQGPSERTGTGRRKIWNNACKQVLSTLTGSWYKDISGLQASHSA